jgi:hypothetical protein
LFWPLWRISVCMCSQKIKITLQRKKAKENLEYQAKRMTRTSDNSYPSAEVGTTVTIKVSEVDKGRGNFRTILEKKIRFILEISDLLSVFKQDR